MADLTEASTFHAGIYQIEETDPVVGGPPDLAAGEGITNVPTKQLADRTRWLKDEIAAKTAPAALLTAIKTVDGTGSGLDADLLDGKHANAFAERSANLSDLTSAATARGNLGLGSMATQAEGTAGSSFRDNAANDAHFLIEANNLSDLTNAGTARTNLGLGDLATRNEGGGAGYFRDNAANDARYLIEGNNLSDLTNVGTARSNLGLGSMATQNNTAVNIDGGTINGITDLAIADGGTGASTAADARTNLGLGTLATQNEGVGAENFRDNAANDGRFLRLSGGTMSGSINLDGKFLKWSDGPDGGDYLQWESALGLVGHENGVQVWRIGSSAHTSIGSIGSNTTSNSANCFVNAGGGMFRSTSSKVHKTDLEPVDGDVVLALRPVTFTSRHIADWDGRYAGFIAEEVEEGFPEASADDGENYDVRAIVAALVAKVQSQHDQILSLTDRLAALEAAQ